MHYGLLGRNLSHSYSPQIHNALVDYDYALMEIEPEYLETFMQTANFRGINVTIPYKKAVLPYCSSLSEQAQRLKAVNTIVRKDDGTLLGHNTDYFGFQELLRTSGLNVQDKKVLVLGSGGAGVTASAVLADMGAKVITISRNAKNNYNNIHLHTDAAVIVNATPVGMYPNNGQSPINLNIFRNLEGVLDLIYNPSKTALLLQAEEMGLTALNGLYMLVAQAKESAEYFSGVKISNKKIDEVHEKLKQQTENIILIGMPGCGKTTIGAILAKRLNREYIDTDQLLEKQTGVSVPSYIERFGIDKFRFEESQIIRRVSKQSGLVIATGGGCVTQECNYKPLHQNGTIIWIKRAIEDLPTVGRPLSIHNNLQDIYDARSPLYEHFADIQITNDTTPKMAAEAILRALKGE